MNNWKQKLSDWPRSSRKIQEITPESSKTKQRLAEPKPTTKKNKIACNERSIDSKVTIDPELKWRNHPEAWAFLLDSNNVGYYLNGQYSEDERKGYLIGSDSLCDLTIPDDRIQARHCLIYTENFTDINNECSIRVFLRDISDPACPTSILVNRKIVNKQTKEPVWLQNTDQINFISSTGSRFFKYRILLSPKTLVKTFQDEFTLGTLIARGNCADVHIATLNNPGANRPHLYVVKIIEKEKIKRQQEPLPTFEEEVGVLMLLKKHPGIVGILKVYDSIEHYYIIMDYIPEGELHAYIASCHRLNEDSAKIIFRQLFDTVEFLHNAGVVHRDIKPENIMLVSKAHLQVKLCDFGFASLQDELLVTRCGTPDYLAPEVLYEESPYGKECDLWSLGVVLYVCLGGSVPFRGNSKNGLEKQDNIKAGKFEFSGPVWEMVSLNAKSLIQGLLNVDRNKRLTVSQALNHPWFDQK